MASTVNEISEKSHRDAKELSFDDALKETQFGKFHYFLFFVSGGFMASSFYKTMGVNYVLTVAECDLNITSKQQYGIISGIWFAGSTSTIYAYLGEFLVAKNRSRSMMILSFIFGALCLFVPGNAAGTLKIFRRIYYVNAGNKNYSIDKIKPDEEFEQCHERKHVLTMMFNQSVSLFRDYPRSITLISMIQFGIYFVCNGILLFFPDIINQRAQYTQSSVDMTLCEIIENSIVSLKNSSDVDMDLNICVEKLDISTYY